MIRKNAYVEAHPATDTWMQGDRFGRVVKVGRVWVHVRMTRSGKVRRFLPGTSSSRGQ